MNLMTIEEAARYADMSTEQFVNLVLPHVTLRFGQGSISVLRDEVNSWFGKQLDQRRADGTSPSA